MAEDPYIKNIFEKNITRHSPSKSQWESHDEGLTYWHNEKLHEHGDSAAPIR